MQSEKYIKIGKALINIWLKKNSQNKKRCQTMMGQPHMPNFKNKSSSSRMFIF